jgi:hypothetical protein
MAHRHHRIHWCRRLLIHENSVRGTCKQPDPKESTHKRKKRRLKCPGDNPAKQLRVSRWLPNRLRERLHLRQPFQEEPWKLHSRVAHMHGCEHDRSFYWLNQGVSTNNRQIWYYTCGTFEDTVASPLKNSKPMFYVHCFLKTWGETKLTRQMTTPLPAAVLYLVPWRPQSICSIMS